MTWTFNLWKLYAAALLVTATSVPAAGSNPAERNDFTGTWQLNEELSENPRDKMREAMSSRGGRGGGRGGFGGPGGGGGFGGGRGGFGGPGGGRGGPSDAGGNRREEMQQRMRALEESYQLLEINHREPEMLVRYGEERRETIYTDGRAFDRTVGRGEVVEAKAKWKGKERIVVKAEGERGEVTETWEWVADAGQLWLTVKVSGSGRMPGFEYRRVYDPVEADEADDEAMVDGETSSADDLSELIHLWH